MRNHLLLVALLIGCGIEPTPKLERLEVAPIPGLTAYRSGKVFHPWRVDLDEPERYPMPAPGKAPDALCWMGDSYYMDCVVYECDAALTCPTGWTCQDVRIQMDPPQDVAQDEGWLLYKYPAYHLAACVKP